MSNRPWVLWRPLMAKPGSRRWEMTFIPHPWADRAFVIGSVLVRVFEASVADLLDWKPTRSYEVEARLEIDDVQQMVEAQNELRRKRGAEEITEADVERMAREDEAVRARGRGPFRAEPWPEDR